MITINIILLCSIIYILIVIIIISQIKNFDYTRASDINPQNLQAAFKEFWNNIN